MGNITITDEITSLFVKEPTALIIWLDTLIQIEKDNTFIPRRKTIKEKYSLGEKRLRNAIKFLKENGLVETLPVYIKGKMTGSEYKFYKFENRVENPSPTNTRGPQSKTKAMRDKKQPKALPNKEISERYQKDYSAQEAKPHATHPLIPFKSKEPDEHKKTFLEHFIGQNTFQTFDDSTLKRRELSRVYHSYNPLNLDAKNNKGAGIFLNINETDGKGRKKQNNIRVRAVFADLDGAPLGAILEYHPSMVVETSPGKYHTYWFTDDVPLDQFTNLLKAIANKFNSDPKVCILTAVLRVPGFYHCKGEPTLSRVLYTSENRYSFDELKAMFPSTPKQVGPVNNKPIEIRGAHKDDRNDTLCRMIGALKKRGFQDREIETKAHEFGKKCVPPLRARQIDSTLKSARQWEP